MPNDQEFDVFVTEIGSVGFVERGSDSEADVLIVREEPDDDEAPTIMQRITAWLRGGDSTEDSIPLTREEALELLRDRNIGEFLESRIHAEFTLMADEMFGSGELTREERIAASSAIGSGLDAFRQTLTTSEGAGLYDRDFGMLSDTDVARDADVSTENTDVGTVRDVSGSTPQQEGSDMPDNEMVLSDEQRAELTDEQRTYIEDMERRVADSDQGDDDSAVSRDEDILRDADPEIQTLVRAAQERAEAAEARADESLEMSRGLIADRETQRIAGLVERFAGVYPDEDLERMIRDSSDEAATVLSLEAMQERLELNALTREFGRTGGGGNAASEAEGRLEAIAREAMTHDPALKYEAAYLSAYKANPDLAAVTRTTEVKRSGRVT